MKAGDEMKGKRHSTTGLMLVEDPRKTLTTLCRFAGAEVDWDSFKSAYEAEIGRVDDPIDEKHADTHFYTLTLYKLLLPTGAGEGKYRLSDVAKDLCVLLCDPQQQREYRRLLANLLRTNDAKGHMFRDFVEYVKVKRSREDIYRKFKSIPGRTLIAWAKEAGLVATYEDDVCAIKVHQKRPTQAEFRRTLVAEYRNMQRTTMLGVRHIYVPIGDLRFNLGVKLDLDRNEFDAELKKLLANRQGTKIVLYGAPTNVFEEFEFFEYSGRRYVYLSMKV